MERPGEDDSIKAVVEFDGSLGNGRKNRSDVWEEFQPICVNGKTQFAVCLSCHNRFCYTGDSYLRRHLKTCPAKPEVPQEDSYFTNATVQDISSVVPRKLKSNKWEGLTPIYAEGKLQAADCNHCHKRLANNGGHLARHFLACSKRHGRGQIHQKGNRSSLPNLKSKSRVQDEPSPARTLRITKCSGKLRKDSSSSGITRRPIQVVAALPASDGTSLKKHKTSGMTTETDLRARKFGQDSPYQDVAKLIALHGYPLSIVENEEMRRILKNVKPVPNTVALSDMEGHLLALFQKDKIKVKDKIALTSQRVSLSASIWTHDGPEPTVNYLCLTAHFITEDWKVHRMVIKFGMYWCSPTNLERTVHCKEACVPESESGSYNVIWDAIRDWNLGQKILSLTSVGEIKNDANTSKLKEMLIEKRCLPIRGKLYNVACVDDMLNSVVSEVQSHMLFLVGDIVKDFFGACASSSLTQQQLLEVISQMNLKCPREDAKWWHKLHFRLEALLQFKKLFPAEKVLSPENMIVIRSICKILRTFYRVIEVICNPCSQTANIYFGEVWKVRTVLQEEALNDHGEIATLVMEMQEVFDEYWQNSYLWLSIPVVFDPRVRMSFIEFRLERAYGTDSLRYLSEIHDTVQELFSEYYSPRNQPGGGGADLDRDDNDPLEDWDEHLSSQRSSELDAYLGDVLIPRKDDFNILDWWMKHTTQYPTLAAIARDVLAMPASAVQSEAAFSSTGPVIPKYHSTLSIKTIEALVCTRDWMR
ncbi:unnamed protein product [Alopecurus aequalis]